MKHQIVQIIVVGCLFVVIGMWPRHAAAQVCMCAQACAFQTGNLKTMCLHDCRSRCSDESQIQTEPQKRRVFDNGFRFTAIVHAQSTAFVGRRTAELSQDMTNAFVMGDCRNEPQAPKDCKIIHQSFGQCTAVFQAPDRSMFVAVDKTRQGAETQGAKLCAANQRTSCTLLIRGGC